MTPQILSLPALWGNLRAKVIGRKFVQDVGVLTIANFAGAALSLCQSIVVARWLGPHLYGVAVLIMGFPNLLFGILDARSTDVSVKYLGEFSATGAKDQALAVCKLSYVVDIGTGVSAFVLVAATAWWAGERIVHSSEVTWLIILYAAAFLPSSLSGTSRAILAILGRFSTLAWVEGLSTILRVLLVLGLVYTGWEVAGVIWGNALALAFHGLILGLLAFPLLKRTWGAYGVAGSWRRLRGRHREILSFFFFNNINVSLGLFVKQFDLIILGYWQGPTQAGYYRLAKSIGALVGNMVGPLQSRAYPHLASLWGAKQHDEMKRTIWKYSLWVGAPLGVMVLASLPFLSLLINTAVGNQYLGAALPAQLILTGSAIWIGFFWLRPLFLAVGQVNLYTRLYLFSLLPYLVSFFYLMPKFGARGMAAGYLGHALLLLLIPGIRMLKCR